MNSVLDSPNPRRLMSLASRINAIHRALTADELAELPLALQAKLLHVLQDFQFSRVGGLELLQVDTRVVADES